MTTLAHHHDCLLLDLDGTVYRGHEPTPGALAALAAVTGRTVFITNNASRSPEDIATHLGVLGFNAVAADVATSAQSAARLLAGQLPQNSSVLVIGTDSLVAEITNVTLNPVRRYADQPVAVVQGHSPATGWSDLAEATLAIRGGALWVAANVDRTLPTEQGLLPGNGAMVAALRAATDCEPLVAGKPGPALIHDALSRGQFRAPLVVGDRLDTDIAGANAAGLPSLMVLTGVSTATEVIYAAAEQRPTFIGADLRALHSVGADLTITSHPAWRVEVSAGALVVSATGADPGDDGLSVIRASAQAMWQVPAGARRLPVLAGDDRARMALQSWSVGVC